MLMLAWGYSYSFQSSMFRRSDNEMKDISWSDAIFNAVRMLGGWAIISATFYAVKIAVRTYRGDKRVKFADSFWGKAWFGLCTFSILLFFSYGVASTLGTHTEGADPRFGDGETV